MKTLLLIDGHAMIHRAYHALPATLTAGDGTPTNAIYGFFLMLQKVIDDFKPTHIAVAFDTPKPTFRKKLFTGYQAKRPPIEDTLKVQIPKIKELLAAGGVRCVEKPGFEADDVIGTLSQQHKKDFDRVLILTGDRDLVQLTDEKVFLIAPIRGVTEFHLFTPHEVMNKYGVTPEHIPDYKALAGDASDNYNTAKGIGPKTAQTLLQIHPTVEELLNNLDDVSNPRWKAILQEHTDTILLFKKIATIIRDVDVSATDSELAFSGFRKPMQDDLKKFELFSLVKKLYTEFPEREKKEKTDKKNKSSMDQIHLF